MIAGTFAAPVCAPCHPRIQAAFAQTGMARSFSRPSPANVPQTPAEPYRHAASGGYFTVERRGAEYFQRGYQIDAAGKPINVTEKRIDYVMGSGAHARTYLTRNPSGGLTELPLGWYSENGGYWAMNPGYDRPDHDWFRRPIAYDCMFCHNAYPRVPPGHDQPFSEPLYAAPLPEGIDCARCHGDGARHIRLAGAAGAKPEDVRGAIVNPARLSADRQMDGCMVCHLETTSFPLPNALPRAGRSPFFYRPGEPLADFLLNFDHAPEAGRNDKFELVSAAYRLRRSACFLKSGGKLLCTTCHNPHDIPRGEAAERQYTAVCLQCHPRLQHARTDGCIGCHMPKRRTEDVVHASVTDHLIARFPPPGDPLEPRAEREDAYRGRVVLYYPPTLPETPANTLDLAAAQVLQGSNLTAGVAELSAAISKYRPPRAEYYLYLGDALLDSGDPARAVDAYRDAIRRTPASAVAQRKLGTALRRQGKPADAATALVRASVLAPNVAVTWHELGLAYRAAGRPDDAARAIERSLALDPELPEAHNNLGLIRFERRDLARAEASFREAIRIRPGYGDAHGNLAALLSGAGRSAEARTEFETALRLNPRDAGVHYNYAMLLGRNGDPDSARRELESSLRADPGFLDSHLLLADLLRARGETPAAVSHYREAVQIAPDSPRAHLGLASALIETGDAAGALPHLRLAITLAASGADAAIREQASALLGRLSVP